jgi:hypothetical protein
MTVEYLVAKPDGSKVSGGKFDSESATQRRDFAMKAKRAWESGYAVITKALDD